VYICQGQIYVDDGATALDNCDGDISGNIQVMSPVDTDVPGTYTITYNVSDDAGNEADEVTRTVIVQPKPAISNSVTSSTYNQVMVSGGSYAHTQCHDVDIITSVPTLTSTLATACGTLRLQTEYISTLPNIPSATLDATFAQAVAAGPQTISPENHTGTIQTITFITTPYYDVNGNQQYDPGIDIAGDVTTFVLTIEPKPAISNSVTSSTYNQVMVSGGSYTHTQCHDEDIITSVPTLTSTLATACGTLRLQTEYISTLPNIPSATLDVTFAQAVAAGPQTISPENHTGTIQTITFITTPYYDVNGNQQYDPGIDIAGDVTTFVLTIEPKPAISNSVTSSTYNQVMVSGGSYAHTQCHDVDIITSVPTLTSTLATACGTLRLQTEYISTLLNIPSATLDATFAQAVAAGPQTISPENHTGTIQTITFITTPYYDVNGNQQYDPGIDIAGDVTTFVLTIEPKPAISNSVTSSTYNQVMVSGGSYTHTQCHDVDIITSVPTLTSTLATACGTLRLQTEYISTLPNIPSATLDATFAQAVAAGPQTISPENHTGTIQTITFITTPYYDVNGNQQYDPGIDIAGDVTTFVLTIEPKPAISNSVTSSTYNQVMVSGGSYAHTQCHDVDIITSVPTLTSTLATACGT
jgi:hypothetical protein